MFLGSDKDVEDAQYLWDIFREMVNPDVMDSFLSSFNIDGEKYGIKV